MVINWKFKKAIQFLGNYIASYSILINLLMNLLNGAIGTASENHANTISSMIAAKQTVINEVLCVIFNKKATFY